MTNGLGTCPFQVFGQAFSATRLEVEPTVTFTAPDAAQPTQKL